MTDILAEGRTRAEAYNIDGEGFKNIGRKNAYECDSDSAIGKVAGCGSYIVTVDRDPGVTPFMLKCGNCGQFAHSKFYRVQDWLEPTHEWYRPDTLEGVPKGSHHHLSKGGLILRPVAGGADKWLRPGLKPKQR